MIELTPLAAEKLSEIRLADPSHGVLRVYLAGKSCSGYRYGLAFDVAAEKDDTVVERSGIPVAVDPLTLEAVQGSTIDFVDEAAGKGFVVRNPNAVSGGGCGSGGCGCGR